MRGFKFCGFATAIIAVCFCCLAPPASARTVFPVYGANGDAGATDECPGGSYFVGVVGNVGAWVDQITVVCAKRKPDGSIGGGKSLSSRGGTGGGFRKEMCGTDEVITSINVSRTKDYQTRGLDFVCKNVKNGSTHTLYFGGNAPTGASPQRKSCSQSEAATGMVIRWGKYVNGLGLICNDIANAAAGAIPETCKWFGSNPTCVGNCPAGWRYTGQRRSCTISGSKRLCCYSGNSPPPPAPPGTGTGPAPAPTPTRYCTDNCNNCTRDRLSCRQRSAFDSQTVCAIQSTFAAPLACY
jgi:hypothetical protein